VVEGGAGSFDGRVDVVDGGGVDGADFLLVGGVYAGDELVGGGFDELIVDEEAGGECELFAVGSCEVDREVGHFGGRKHERSFGLGKGSPYERRYVWSLGKN
jgi:hypothetical protein